MAINNLGLGLLFTAQDRASGVVTGLNARIGTLGTSADRSSKALQLGLGGAIAAKLGTSLSGLTEAAASFEFGLAKAGNIAMATAADLKVMRNAAIDAGLATEFSPTQATAGLQNLAAAGFNAAESAKLLQSSLLLAQAGQVSIADATAIASTSIKLFNLQGRDQELMVDKLLKTTNLFKIQAIDLEQALAKTSTAALLTGQSFDEMLVSAGLIKNVFPDAGEAGNSVGRAMQSIAQKADQLKSKLKIDALDPETGQFKKTLDLFIEIDAASKKTFDNEAKRAKFLTKTFGAFGAKGFAAAIGSLTEFATKNKVTLQEAAQYYRDQVSGAEGTAQSFLDGLLATYEGQKKILTGAVQTLAVVLGEPLIKVLQPSVKFLAETFSDLARVVRDMDPAIKEAVARFALITAASLTLGGALAIVRAGAAFAIPILKSMALSLATTLVAAAPLTLALLVLGAVVKGFADAMGFSMGGATSSFADFASKVSLGFRGLVQLFTKGGFSGAVKDELDKAENSSIKSFIETIFRIGFRFKRFFAGISSGVVQAFDGIKPSLVALKDAFVGVARALGLMGLSGKLAVQNSPSQKFFAAGAAVGRVFTRVIGGIARGISHVVRLFQGLVEGTKSGIKAMAPSFQRFGAAAKSLGEAFGFTSKKSKEVTKGLPVSPLLKIGRTIGDVFGRVVGIVADVVGFVMRAWAGYVKGITSTIKYFRSSFDGLWQAIQRLGKTIGGIFQDTATSIGGTGGTVESIATKIGNVVGFTLTVVAEFATVLINTVTSIIEFGKNVVHVFGIVWQAATVPMRITKLLIEQLRAEIEAIIGVGKKAYDWAMKQKSRIDRGKEAVQDFFSGSSNVYQVTEKMRKQSPSGTPMSDLFRVPSDRTKPGKASEPSLPTVTTNKPSIQNTGIDPKQMQSWMDQRLAEISSRPININVQGNVDGETLFRINSKYARENAGRAFQVVGTDEMID